MAKMHSDRDGNAGRKRLGLGVVACGFVLAAALAPVAEALADGPFDQLVGTWRGSGKVSLTSGNTESLKCKAYYTPKSEGAELGIAIRCASPGNSIELRAKLSHSGNQVTGEWEERTYNATGIVSGDGSVGKLQLSITGGAFTGTMTVQTNGTQQTVTIRTNGIALTGVNMNLSKG